MKPSKHQFPLITMIRARRFLVLSAVSWAIMLFLLLAVVIPRVQIAMTLRTTNESSQLALEKLQDKASFLESFKNSEFDSLNERVQRILPSNKPFLQMLSTLEQLSTEEGVYFAGLDVNPGLIATDSANTAAPAAPTAAQQAKEGITQLDLLLTVYGTADQISSFMDKVTTIAPALDVRTFSSSVQRGTFSGQIGDGTEPIYEAVINLASLYAPVAGTISVNQSLPTLTDAENEYARVQIPQYVIYQSQNQALPAEGGLGKPDPFAP